MEDSFDAPQLTGETAMLFDHAVAQHISARACFGSGASPHWMASRPALNTGK
jgi:hypothetical protein